MTTLGIQYETGATLEIPIDLVKVGSPTLPELVYSCKDCGKNFTRQEYYGLVQRKDYPYKTECKCGGVNFSVAEKEK